MLRNVGILKGAAHDDVSSECMRFRNDPAFTTYKDAARFNIINQLAALELDDVEGFQRLKRFQMALDGFDDYIESAIMNETMKNRHQR
jgi:hypothetical protein